VSHETKVPILASNGVDITITTLCVSESRLKVIDFVLYSRNADCLYGLASNEKIAKANTVDDLNNPDIKLWKLITNTFRNGFITPFKNQVDNDIKFNDARPKKK
jgi:hypothetical protein